jgi:hypothetical protein
MVNYKVLGQAAPGATTPTDLFTVPAATQVVVSSLTVCNRAAVVAHFRVSVSVGGGATANKDYRYYDVLIPPNDTFIATTGWTLGTGDVVRVYSDTANLSFGLDGSEIT